MVLFIFHPLFYETSLHHNQRRNYREEGLSFPPHPHRSAHRLVRESNTLADIYRREELGQKPFPGAGGGPRVLLYGEAHLGSQP